MMKILDITINPITKSALFDKLSEILLSETTTTGIYKINTEFLVRAIGDSSFKGALNLPGLNIVDGRGVLWAARYLTLPVSDNHGIRLFQAVWQMFYSGAAIVFNPKFITYPVAENIPGVEALKLMLKAAEETGSEVFFFGATQHDLEAATKNIKKEMPRLKIAGSLNGYDFQKDSMMDPVSIINESGAKLLVVALGSPLQEYWIRNNLGKLPNVRVAVGEGGSLAFLAGTLRRAPKLAQKIGLEWLWRLFMNKSLTHQTGSRLKRVWNAVPVFIYEVVKWKIKNGAIDAKTE